MAAIESFLFTTQLTKVDQIKPAKGTVTCKVK